MIKFTNKILLVLLSVVFLLACTKDKVMPCPEPPVQIELWEQFIGSYKVYDTTGTYLYDMEIYHTQFEYINGGYGDSIHMDNFDNNFDLGFQYTPSVPNDYLPLGFHNPINGINDGYTWQIYGEGGDENGRLINDTLHLAFEKTNIQYYIQELTPYFHCNCNQIAVKQN